MGHRVLVVEDDEMVAEVVRVNLEAEGLTVVHVTNGPAGLNEIARERPDLVLLDVMIPEMDGWAVLSKLRGQADTEKLPVVMLTAKSMPADQVRGYQLGASGYITKPFSVSELLEKVRHALEDRNGMTA